MPPKRQSRAAAKDPAPAGDVGAGANKALKNWSPSQGTPLPAQYSTSYGSPLRIPASGGVRSKYGTNTAKASADIFAAVRKDNRAAARARQDAADQGVRTRVPLREEEEETGKDSSLQPEVEDEEEDEAEEENTEASRARELLLAQEERKRQERNAQRAKEVSSPLGPSSNVPGTSQSARSFVEESRVFGDATMRTSEAGSSPAGTRPSAAEASAGRTTPRSTRSEAAITPPSRPSDFRVTPATAQSHAEGSGRSLRSTEDTPHDIGGLARRTYDAPNDFAAISASSGFAPQPRGQSRPQTRLQSLNREQTSGTALFGRGKNNQDRSGDDALPEKAPFAPRAPNEEEPTPVAAGLFLVRDLLGKAIKYTGILLLVLVCVKWTWFTVFPAEMWKDVQFDSRPQWYGWSDWRHNIGQLFPPVMLSSTGARFGDDWDSLHEALSGPSDDVVVHRDTLDQIAQLLPSMVEMKLDKNGRPKITAGFWHAIHDLARQDADFLTFSRDKSGKAVIAEDHWDAFRIRFEKEGLTKNEAKSDTTALSIVDIEDAVQRALPKSWEIWINDNKKKVQALLREAGDLPKSTEKQLETRVGRLVQDALKAERAQRKVVTKDEFMKLLEKHLSDHKKEIEAELTQVRKRLGEVIDGATSAVQHPPAGVTREEATNIAKQVVKEYRKNLQLEAASKSSIHMDFETQLRQQANLFSPGNGAIPDQDLSSPPFVFDKPVFKSRPWWRRWQGPVTQDAPHMAALLPWEEASDCWCAGVATSNNATSPADLAVLLARRAVPQTLVVEHIAPGATLDEGSTPRDFEVWIHLEEHSVKANVDGFAATHFAQSQWDHPLRHKGFHKVGEFRYTYETSKNGVYVYPLADTLAELGAASDFVLIRALTNHGSPDHTCIYRVRLYGQVVDEE